MKKEMKNVKLFTSESVCEGHPDKVCDLIADTILDEAILHDPNSRIACEVCVTTGMVLVMGEFTTERYIDIPSTARRVIKQIGYDNPELGFDANTVAVLTYINQQSPDIARGVSLDESEPAESVGAGDQGMMFGYATDETECLMPLPITLAHGLTARLAEVRKSRKIAYLRPDGKAQVTVAYDGGIPLYVDTVVVSCQHDPSAENAQIVADIKKEVIQKVIPAQYLTENTKIYINPTGRFVVGGPHGDSGLTGRKIIVDTYGGMCAHGGGSFSGKDGTKVDRSAGYYARYVCKNIVAAGLAKRCMIQIAYAIGKSHPVSVYIDTLGTGKFSDSKLSQAVLKTFDFRPYAIIEQLKLKTPVFAASTNYGHFGKADLPWEQTDRAEKLKQSIDAE